MLWSDLCAAVALYLVLEGVLPFVNPQAMKRAMLSVANLGDATLRTGGLVAIVIGLALLSWARL